MENMELVMEKMAELLEKQNAKLEEIGMSVSKSVEDLKSQEEVIAKALIQEEKEEKEKVNQPFSVTTAKSEATNWTPEQKGRFVDFVKMVKQQDEKAIEKAFGDNVYTLTTTAGGYLIPTEFRPELARLELKKSIALQKATVVPVPSLKMKMPSVTAGMTVAWGSVNTQITDTAATLGEIDLSTEPLTALSIVPNQLIKSSAISVADMIANEITEAFAEKLDEEVFMGDSSGDSANHKFDGIGYASSVNSVAGSTDASPTFAELLTEANLLAMAGKLDQRTLNGAEWYFHPNAWAVIRAIQDGSSSSIVRLNEDYKFELLGYPVNLVSEIQSSAAVSTPVGFFGNLKHVYIGDGGDFSIAASEHERFSYDQTIFRGIHNVSVAVAFPSALVKIVFGAAS